MRNQFYSCDWGSSRLRVRLVDESGHVVDSALGPGIAEVYETWQRSGSAERFSFFLQVIERAIDKISNQQGEAFQDLPVVVSGMASSTLGMIELPYATLPFHVEGKNLVSELVNSGGRPILVISGFRSDIDVIRGEETQLIGCAALHPSETDMMVLLPGTHSKFVEVQQRQVISFSTYMTGEVFNLLLTKSMLAASIKSTAESGQFSLHAFRAGLDLAGETPLLTAIFRIRTNQLFARFTPEENYDFLSGLLIGSELLSILQKKVGSMFICGETKLGERYMTALRHLGFAGKVKFISGDDAVIAGQAKLLRGLSS